jgi:hypothetical protein
LHGGLIARRRVHLRTLVRLFGRESCAHISLDGGLVSTRRLKTSLHIGLLCRESEPLRLLHRLLVRKRGTHLRVHVRLLGGEPKASKLKVALLVRDLPALRKLHHILRRRLVGKRRLLLAAHVSLSQGSRLAEGLSALLGDKPITLTRRLSCSNPGLNGLSRTTEGTRCGSATTDLCLSCAICAVNISKSGLNNGLLVGVHVPAKVLP